MLMFGLGVLVGIAVTLTFLVLRVQSKQNELLQELEEMYNDPLVSDFETEELDTDEFMDLLQGFMRNAEEEEYDKYDRE